MLRGSKLVFAILSVVLASLSVEASMVKGVISDQSGAPIPKASVGFYSADSDWKTYADAEGKFSLEVPSGMYELEVQFPGFLPKLIRNFKVGAVDPISIPVVLVVGGCPPCCGRRPGCNISDVSYEDSPGRSSINGQLISSSDRPAPVGVKVSLLKADGDMVMATTQTSTGGGFQFEGLEAGRYNVHFSDGCRNITAFNVRVRRGKISVLKDELGAENNLGVSIECPVK
jgi:hypothetical protein